MVTQLWVDFKGSKYIMLNEMVLATEEQFVNGYLAHAAINGNDVIRHGEIIGHLSDIKILGLADDVKVDAKIAMNNMLLGKGGWSWGK